MKKLVILISLLLFGSTIAQAQTDPFEKLMDMKGVTTVYISKAMLGMMSGADVKNMSVVDGVNIEEVVKKLTSITVLTSESQDAIKAIQKLGADIKNSKAYEQLMFAKSDDTKATIYAKVANGEESEMVILVNDSSSKQSTTMIRLTGTMTLADIQKITADTKK